MKLMVESESSTIEPSIQNREAVETPESSFDAELNEQYESLLQHEHPLNFGTYGLIYRMNLAESSQDLRTKLQQQGVDVEQGPAVKVLKIYTQGKGQREYAAQKRAYEIISRSSQTELAQVPKPLESRAVKINAETRRILNQEGASISGDQVEAIMMDYIDGPDLATVFYRWIVDHAPADKEYIKQSTHPDDFEQLQTAVSEILEFVKPGGKSPDEAEREAERHGVNNLNSKKVYNFLKKTGFRLNPKIAKHIRNTLKVFEAEGFYHNDDHERNFMVVGDYSGDGDVTTYIIDFDKAGPSLPDSLSFRIDKQLEELAGDDNKKMEQFKEVEGKINNLAWIKSQAGFFPEQEAVSPEILRNRLRAFGLNAASSEAGFENYAAIMLKLVRDGILTNSEAISNLSQIKERLTIRDPKKNHSRIINPNIFNRAETYKELFN